MNDNLLQRAVEARKKAYAPYSGYQVGAAILGPDGSIWAGCNVENISYGLSICAERSAICRMVSDGCLEVRAVYVSTRDGGTPCGMCLQSLLEFAVDPASVEVCTFSDSGVATTYFLSELIPHGFTSPELRRT